jgi:hypothetical protein
MKWFTWGLVCWSAMVGMGAFAGSAAAAPQFPQCPAVGADTGCQYLITVNQLGVVSIASDPSQPSYATNLAATHESGPPTDALIGIQNDSGAPVSSLDLTGPIIAEFDGDGICDNASGAVPGGCRAPSGSTACGAFDGPCSFPPPPSEPAGYTDFSEPPLAMPAWPNGDVQNGYEGPTSWFSNVAPSPHNGVTVNLSPAVPPAGSTYFALESVPTLRITTWLTATQTAAGTRSQVVYLPRGTWVENSAQLSGGNGHVGGNVTFVLFHGATCSGSGIPAGISDVSAGTLVSKEMVLNAPGKYLWQVSYAGDGKNAPSVTNCGAQTVVVPKTGKIGLPASRRCMSVLSAKLQLGRQRVRAAEVFANGKLLGTFGAKIRLRIRKHERIAVIASSDHSAFARGLTDQRVFRQQSQSYRAC